MGRLTDFFRKLLHRSIEKPKVVILDNNPLSIASYLEEHEHIAERLEREEFQRNHVEPHLRRPETLGDIRAVRKMKHGHQAPWYRKNVKTNVKPEEDD